MNGSPELDVLAVVFGEGNAGESIADVLFVLGVDIERLPDIREDGLSGVWQR